MQHRLFTLIVTLSSLISSAPPLEAVQCPRDSVSVDDDGSLMYRPLSPGTADIDPSYDPGAIGGWYSLAAGFVDVVRSGSLPYSEYHAIVLAVVNIYRRMSLIGNEGGIDLCCPTNWWRSTA